MQSRHFIALSLLVLCGSLHAEPDAKAHRPNILYCVADDWSYGHASIYGDKVVKTPNFDRIAREGALFHHVFCAASSCTPSRGAMLTGRPVHQLEDGANLWSTLPAKFRVYPDVLEEAGYAVGCEGKGWAPGDFKAGGRKRNPAGPQVKSFEDFLAKTPKDQPFCFWYGSHDPHRPYELGSGVRSGMNPAEVQLPSFWPDSPIIRSDVCDYYFAVQRFDRRVGELLQALEAAGRLDDTLVVVTSDNGMPFPRGKATCYDLGSRMPLAMRWPGHIAPGTVINRNISQVAFAPTFLDVAGLKPLSEMTEKSLLPVMTGQESLDDQSAPAFFERERHANVRKGNVGYPVRAVRTKDFLYIHNIHPERWPAGDPEMVFSVGEFGDIDPGPTKDFIKGLKDDPDQAHFYRLSMAKRQEEELYDLKADPQQLHNLAGNTEMREVQGKLQKQLDQWMKDTDDPRATQDDDHWDRYQYYGKPGREMAPVQPKP